MFKVIDNFLSPSDFALFSKLTQKASTSFWGTLRTRSESPDWIHTLFKSEHPDIESETSKRFGSHIWDVASSIESKIKDDVELLPPLFSLSYLFSKQSYFIKPHFDNIYRQDPRYRKPEYCADSYSAFLYGHESWNTEWGGILGFHKNFYVDYGKRNNFDKDNYVPIEPIPNRLIYYSLDEVHSVTPIIPDNVVRKTLKISFFRITKQRRHYKSVDSQIDHTIDF
jgi:hypothetical protein